MNEQIKADWIAALRSGEYKQTTGSLRRLTPRPDINAPSGMCCLGVLCDLARKAGLGDWTSHIDDGYFGLPSAEDYGSNVVLPEVVRAWAGLDENDPDVSWYDEDSAEEKTNTLASLNDAGLDFGQIAELIEVSL